MKKRRIYISGKITGLKLEDAQRNFQKAEDFILKNTDFIPVNPMKEVPYNPEWEWEDYMDADLELLKTCDAIFMMKNWDDSRGAWKEFHEAILHHLILIIEPKEGYSEDRKRLLMDI